ncbi:MAG: energy transducer TonB [Flavobacteriaceae bacterium]
MEPKKYPKYNINRNSSLYFSLGLTLVLLITYIALEWKSYGSAAEWDHSILIQAQTIEETPIVIKIPKKLSAKKIQSPPLIVIKEDDDLIDETPVESSESNINTEIVPIDSISVLEEIEDEIIDFVLIEEVPVFPGCEDQKDKRRCFQTMMIKHVNKNFRYPKSAIQMGLEGRVFVQFTIEKDGSIGDIKMRGPDKILESEAGRIIEKLPPMIPGKQRGKKVRVPFTMPIVFKLH